MIIVISVVLYLVWMWLWYSVLPKYDTPVNFITFICSVGYTPLFLVLVILHILENILISLCAFLFKPLWNFRK
jgi:hypothetical protein